MMQSELTTLDAVKHGMLGEIFCCAVHVTNINEVVTCGHHVQMAFIEVRDLTGKQEVIFFPRTYKTYKHMLKEGETICLTCERDTAEIDINANECQKVKIIGLAVERLEEKQ